MEYEHLRPLTVGEILDSSFRLYRRRFGALVGVCAVVVIPLALVQLVVNLSAQGTTTVTRFGSSTFRSTSISSGTQLFLLLFGLLISGLNIALAQGAAMRILSDHYLGTETSWSESLQYAFTRFGSLLWIVILSGLAWIFGGLFCVIPGIYLYVSFAVVMPVRLIEGWRPSGQPTSRPRRPALSPAERSPSPHALTAIAFAPAPLTDASRRNPRAADSHTYPRR